MTKEQLVNLRDSIKATIRKINEESDSIETFSEKAFILFEKVTEKCEGHMNLVKRLFGLCIEELQREKLGDFQYMLNEIENRRVREQD